MKKLISVLVIFMLVAVSLSACAYKSTKGADYDNSIVNRELADYLEKYATETFEGDYVRLDAVEGLSYVYNEYASDSGEVSGSVVTVYNQGICCGSFDMIELPKGGVQNQMQLMEFHAMRSSHGNVELQAQEIIDGVVRYTFLISDMPFVYGDTEWLIAAGLFADEEEACKETYEDVDVIWSREGAEWGYCFTVNKALISDKVLAQLVEAVSFKEGAFEDINMDKPLWAEGGVPSFQEERREIFTMENASHLAYEIELGEVTYCVPEHTIALGVDEDTWEVYCYDNTLIGSITLSDGWRDKFEINVMDFNKTGFFIKK